MTNPILERERKKLEWLRAKLAEQERWVSELERRERDPLDDLFEREVTTAATLVPDALMSEPVEVQTPGHEPASMREHDVVAAPAPMPTGPWADWTRPVRRLPPSWLAILKFIGDRVATAEEVRSFIEKEGLLSWDTVRAGLMYYRRDFGLLESPKRGQYRLTKKGLDAVTVTENESPASGGAPESQPHEEVTDLI